MRGRRRLLRQVDDGLRERLGREFGGVERLREPQPRGGPGPEELLGARRHARHDQAPLLERQDLAERVVAAEAHHARCLLDEVLEVLVKLERGDAREPRRAPLERGALPSRQERPVHDERRPREPAVEPLVGAERGVDEQGAVPAASGRHQEEGALLDRGLDVGGQAHLGVRLAREIAREGRLGGDVGGEPVRLDRIVDLRQPVDPDLVVEALESRDHALAPPLLGERRRVVHDVAEAEDEPRSSLAAQQRQRAPHLAEQPERLLVDQEEIGPEDPRRVLDDGGPEREGLLDMEVEIQARVLAVPALDDPGHADEVDAGAEAEAPQDRRAAQDEHVELLVMRDQRVGDRPAATEMPQPERIVAVDEDPVLRLVIGARPVAVGRRPRSRIGRLPHLPPTGASARLGTRVRSRGS